MLQMEEEQVTSSKVSPKTSGNLCLWNGNGGAVAEHVLGKKLGQ
jgi:hypothetical protein